VETALILALFVSGAICGLAGIKMVLVGSGVAMKRWRREWDVAFILCVVLLFVLFAVRRAN